MVFHFTGVSIKALAISITVACCVCFQESAAKPLRKSTRHQESVALTPMQAWQGFMRQGNCYFETHNFIAALKAYLSAEMEGTAFGDSDLRLGITLKNISMTLRKTGADNSDAYLQAARNVYGRALQLGKAHPLYKGTFISPLGRDSWCQHPEWMRQMPRCEICGTDTYVQTVQYGLPTENMRERGARGEIVLGGCSPNPLEIFFCKRCKQLF